MWRLLRGGGRERAVGWAGVGGVGVGSGGACQIWQRPTCSNFPGAAGSVRPWFAAFCGCKGGHSSCPDAAARRSGCALQQHPAVGPSSTSAV